MALFAFQLRIRELYKRFVKTWICFDLICQFSKDLIRVFILSYGAQKIHFVDLFCPTVLKRFVSWICFVTQFSKDSTNPTNPHKSLVLSARWIRPNPLDLDSQNIWFSKDLIRRFVLSYCVQKICFVDLFCPKVLKRFVLWICFVGPKISKYSICFILEGFVYDSRILSFNLISFLWKPVDQIFKNIIMQRIKHHITPRASKNCNQW
jgi:hypothetical protein